MYLPLPLGVRPGGGGREAFQFGSYSGIWPSLIQVKVWHALDCLDQLPRSRRNAVRLRVLVFARPSTCAY